MIPGKDKTADDALAAAAAADDGMSAAKKRLRLLMRQKRDALSPVERAAYSREITDRVVSHPAFLQAEALLAYMHCGSEVPTDGIVDYALSLGKRVYVPKVAGGDIVFYRIFDRGECIPGYRGILEPAGDGEAFGSGGNDSSDNAALVLLPGLAFDHGGGRLGYGGGFYDRFLAKHPCCFKMGVAYDFQIRRAVPAADWDRRADVVATEKRSILPKEKKSEEKKL